jgi:hypothetical protein
VNRWLPISVYRPTSLLRKTFTGHVAHDFRAQASVQVRPCAAKEGHSARTAARANLSRSSSVFLRLCKKYLCSERRGAVSQSFIGGDENRRPAQRGGGAAPRAAALTTSSDRRAGRGLRPARPSSRGRSSYSAPSSCRTARVRVGWGGGTGGWRGGGKGGVRRVSEARERHG